LQARRKFGANDAAGEALLDALARARAGDVLRQLGLSLLEKSGWDDWLAGIEPPPPAADDFPEFAREEEKEIDLEPEPAFIDLTAKVSTGRGPMIIHSRLQKWYQPDLGEVLYKESRRLEERFKTPVMVAVVLLWPSADGPAVTGRYQGTDARGRKVDFRYEVRRAWEMEPEAALASTATLMMVPLARARRTGCRN
jgi:hypothetical protein